jgi:hypothetical protein
LHQVGDLFELNVKLRCQKVKFNEDRMQQSHFSVDAQLQYFNKIIAITVRNLYEIALRSKTQSSIKKKYEPERDGLS